MKKFDPLLMVLGMSVPGGLETVEEIRKEKEQYDWPRTTIIALTTQVYQSDIESRYKVGIDDFISKPLNEGILFRKIAEWTGKRLQQ